MQIFQRKRSNYKVLGSNTCTEMRTVQTDRKRPHFSRNGNDLCFGEFDSALFTFGLARFACNWCRVSAAMYRGVTVLVATISFNLVSARPCNGAVGMREVLVSINAVRANALLQWQRCVRASLAATGILDSSADISRLSVKTRSVCSDENWCPSDVSHDSGRRLVEVNGKQSSKRRSTKAMVRKMRSESQRCPSAWNST